MVNRAKWIIGIDEAGRGSIIGELMVGSYAIRENDIDFLKEIGVKDSKMLTPNQRENLYEILIRKGLFSVIPIKPYDIDRNNINTLEEKAAIQNILNLKRQIGNIFEIKSIIIDKFGYLKLMPSKLKQLGFKGDLIVEPKADVNYPVVSAASIIAKVIRDRRIEILRKLYGVKGSGYPSDPETIDYVFSELKKGYKPLFIRYSWETLKGTEYYIKKSKRTSKSLQDFMK
ncbi:ribonuclease H, mammalian HI/archaeal HII subfamily [Caldisphaera lagunensis DSM 15908]|uniref:Ribonuclease n=1 Tax=Caldisphaera lagunensis (strain DSM 15908 / JCM 11604 / ANMR 0165 / IC-154) TaxID=1056495 RepID=L0A8T3_CALLD|nr:ribonuclease HII [Caldisphaera lagunensis]AFZ69829.1 ribonuclease H, mammalian HI/archaeal HII subfamily [Caldisphaera lagunensis DSM 15908]